MQKPSCSLMPTTFVSCCSKSRVTLSAKCQAIGRQMSEQCVSVWSTWGCEPLASKSSNSQGLELETLSLSAGAKSPSTQGYRMANTRTITPPTWCLKMGPARIQTSWLLILLGTRKRHWILSSVSLLVTWLAGLFVLVWFCIFFFLTSVLQILIVHIKPGSTAWYTAFERAAWVQFPFVLWGMLHLY